MPAPTFQFLRIHAHRASAASSLLAEADRVPSHCSHIERPSRPFWRAGPVDLNRFRRFYKWTLRGQAASAEG